MKSKFITTSIAYINAEPHIGFLFELLAGDILKRHYQLQGEEVFLLTGTDEHGVKVAQAAAEAHQAPQEFADQLSEKFKQLGAQFGIDFDYFIRTTNPDHQKFVQKRWQQLQESGVLAKKTYRGLYCNGCEAFKTELEVHDGKCPIHEIQLEKIEEENWFLVIDTEKKQKIVDWINRAVFPVSRRQEVINILDSGAYDEISISRPTTKNSWGIAVPGDSEQVMYVWVDALFNYLSALAINDNQAIWPADIQIIGKDILKFHAIIWPALLLATGYDLPEKLLVHGFITVDGKKLSKSSGNVILPQELLERYGAEASRYLLFRQLNFEDDSNFVWAEFDAIYNGELANGLGNLTARVIGLAKQIDLATDVDESTNENGQELEFASELIKANSLINESDKTITEHQLWKDLVKGGDKEQALVTVIEKLLAATSYLEPFLPDTVKEIRRQLKELDSQPIFPRLK